jgi:2-hydroxy-3-keto-5-methylthiopentenyl-1-phosphate phosphatase
MEPTIRAVLSNLLADDANDIDIIANDIKDLGDGKWTIQYRHPTSCVSSSLPVFVRLTDPIEWS